MLFYLDVLSQDAPVHGPVRLPSAGVRADLLPDTSGLCVTPRSGRSFPGVALHVQGINAASTFLTQADGAVLVLGCPRGWKSSFMTHKATQ